MTDRLLSIFRVSMGGLAVTALASAGVPAWGQERVVYRCPGSVYTDQLTPKEAQRMGCRTLDGTPISVIQVNRPTKLAPPPRSEGAPRPAPSASSMGGGAPSQGGGGLRVDAKEQRARDSDARRILEAELRREQERLAAMRQEFNNGEPERRGEERNFAKYQERVNEMKAAIQRKEADVQALQRELSKLGGGQ